MKKGILLILLFTFLFLIYSCTYKRELKITVLDTRGNRIEGAKVSVFSYSLLETPKDGIVRVRLEPKEYILKVKKPGFFSIKRKVDVSKETEVKFTLLSFREGMSRIVEKLSNDLKGKRNFKVHVVGSFPTGSVNFEAQFLLDEKRIVVRSDRLKGDVVIDYKGGEVKYNKKPFSEEQREYLPKFIDLIKDSVIYLKDYPLKLTLRYSGSTIYFSKISFKEDKGDYEIFGFFVIDNDSLKIKKEIIDFTAYDRLKRKTHYTMTFYYNES